MPTINSDSVAQDQIKALVDRIIRLREEERAIKGDVREVYAEAKANGFDKTILGKIVNYVEKRETSAGALQESEALFDLYLTAYDAAGTVPATHTHEADLTYLVPAHDPITGEIADEPPMSNASGQPGGVDPERKDDAASSGETAPISTTQGGQDDHGGFYVGRQDGEQHDAAPVSRAVGRGEGEDGVDQGQGAGASEPDRDLRLVAGTVDREDEDRGSRHVGGEAHHGVAATTPTDATLRPQTAGSETAVVSQPGSGMLDTAAPIEPAAPLAAMAADGDSVADPAAVTVAPNVVPMRRQWKHSDKPHHDCLKPDMCGGLSNLARCQPCKEAAAAGQVA